MTDYAPAMPRRWPKALLLAAAAVYLPTLVPFVAGPLTGCGHCVATYLTLLPIVPGIVAGALVPAKGGLVSCLLAGALTAALLVAATALARRLPARDLTAAFAVLTPLIGVESFLFAVMLRA